MRREKRNRLNCAVLLAMAGTLLAACEQPSPSDETPTGVSEVAAEHKTVLAAYVPGATAMVSSGTKAKSPRYQMIYTLGQPTQNQGASKSSGYRMKGGLVASNGGR